VSWPPAEYQGQVAGSLAWCACREFASWAGSTPPHGTHIACSVQLLWIRLPICGVCWQAVDIYVTLPMLYFQLAAILKLESICSTIYNVRHAGSTAHMVEIGNWSMSLPTRGMYTTTVSNLSREGPQLIWRKHSTVCSGLLVTRAQPCRVHQQQARGADACCRRTFQTLAIAVKAESCKGMLGKILQKLVALLAQHVQCLLPQHRRRQDAYMSMNMHEHPHWLQHDQQPCTSAQHAMSCVAHLSTAR
jgi:hypothetical protein